MSWLAVAAGVALVAYQSVAIAIRWRAMSLAPPGPERTAARVAVLVVRGGGLVLGLALIAWGLTR
ncbi:MAG: hypothetical protein MUE51_01365 [Thermoleophilia bacterium]|jgi:hypothetical protein|nr:hypothetical protein [Thermoleophilia bacterium]